MQTLRRAVVIFCMACIAAEFLTVLAGAARPARGIKAVAGLYILTVLIALLPGAPAALQETLAQLTTGTPQTVSFGSVEEQLLTDTAAQLEQTCAARCLQKFGVEVRVSLTLETVRQEVTVTRALVQFPAECDAAQKQNVLAYLQQELGTAVEEETS